ncbi:hypothetical protein ACTPEX_18795 [Clostridioides difficile]|uniref:hypothetical protein n=1 Tax=Clostridioides difficile TaxID=1496 RepID=UPI003F8D2634
MKPKYISFHVESSTNVKADIQKLRNYGIGPVLAISPQTSVLFYTFDVTQCLLSLF